MEDGGVGIGARRGGGVVVVLFEIIIRGGDIDLVLKRSLGRNLRCGEARHVGVV